MSDTDKHQPYVEDADSDDEPIEDTKTYISTAPPEEANVSRTRKETQDTPRRKRTSSRSPTTNHHTDSESNAHAKSPLKRSGSRKHRDSDPKGKAKKAERTKTVTYERPEPRSVKTLPNIKTAVPPKRQQDPSFFGLSPPAAPSPIITTAATMARPRAHTANQRPSSYYGPSASRPPPANPRFWPNPPLGTSFPPQSPLHPPTAPPYLGPYPPPHAFAPLPPQPQQQQQPPQQPDYFNQNPRVVQRPEYRRPTSAMGRQFPSPIIGYSPDWDDDQDDGGPVLRRGPSLKKRPTRQEEARVLMPPPRRPKTSVPAYSPFGPPPAVKQHSVSSVTSLYYDDESVDDDNSTYSASEQTRYDYRPHAVRRPSIDPGVMYSGGDPRHHEPLDRRARRNSHLDAAARRARSRSAEREVEDKMQTAQRYQARVDGPTDPLTLDSIRRINSKTPSGGAGTRRSGSSRGGEQQQQHGGGAGYALTSRTAGGDSSSFSEDMTILVRGTATLTIGNAHMDVRDGAEIRIPTGSGTGGGGGGGGGSSDRSSSSSTTTNNEERREREREREREERRAMRDRDRDRDRGGARGAGRATSRAGSRPRGGGVPGAGAGAGAVQYAPPMTAYGGGEGAYPHQGPHYQQQMPMYGGYAPPGSYLYHATPF